jgi:hypothetical protein
VKKAALKKPNWARGEIFLHKIFEKLSHIKTWNKKAKMLLIIGIGIPVWCGLWALFPYEFYSLFFSSIIGANVFILLLCFVVAAVFKALFPFIWRIKPHYPVTVAVSVIVLAGMIYTFSIFYYSEIRYIVAVYLAVPFVANTILFALSKDNDPKVVLPLIRRKPLLVIGYGLLDTVFENLVVLMLFVAAKNVFIKDM